MYPYVALFGIAFKGSSLVAHLRCPSNTGNSKPKRVPAHTSVPSTPETNRPACAHASVHPVLVASVALVHVPLGSGMLREHVTAFAVWSDETNRG